MYFAYDHLIIQTYLLYVFNQNGIIQVKELRPTLAFMSPFSSLKAQLFHYRKSRPASSSQVMRSYFFDLDEIHHILIKKHLKNMTE